MTAVRVAQGPVEGPARPSRASCSPTPRSTAGRRAARPAGRLPRARPPARSSASPTASSTTGRAPAWSCPRSAGPRARAASGCTRSRTCSSCKVVKRLLDAGVSLQNIRVAVEHLRRRGVRDLAGITLFSDGTTVYECTSPEEVVDLLQGGQGVFGIAVSGAMREISGSIRDFPVERADGGSRRTTPPRTSSPAAGRGGRSARISRWGQARPMGNDSLTHRPGAGARQRLDLGQPPLTGRVRGDQARRVSDGTTSVFECPATMGERSTTPRGRVRTRAGRRRSNSSPESLRPQDRAGETPLESDDGSGAVVRRRGKPGQRRRRSGPVNLSGARSPGEDRGGGRFRPACGSDQLRF